LSAPFVHVRLPGFTRAWADAAVPVRRWQRVQWQYEALNSGSLIA
jgi:hypothetical protein